MSFHNKMAQVPMARCAKCDGDLITQKNGFVHCSEKRCVFFASKAHPTGSMPNEGRQV